MGVRRQNIVSLNYRINTAPQVEMAEKHIWYMEYAVLRPSIRSLGRHIGSLAGALHEAIHI